MKRGILKAFSLSHYSLFGVGTNDNRYFQFSNLIEMNRNDGGGEHLRKWISSAHMRCEWGIMSQTHRPAAIRCEFLSYFSIGENGEPNFKRIPLACAFSCMLFVRVNGIHCSGFFFLHLVNVNDRLPALQTHTRSHKRETIDRKCRGPIVSCHTERYMDNNWNLRLNPWCVCVCPTVPYFFLVKSKVIQKFKHCHRHLSVEQDNGPRNGWARISSR